MRLDFIPADQWVDLVRVDEDEDGHESVVVVYRFYTEDEANVAAAVCSFIAQELALKAMQAA